MSGAITFAVVVLGYLGVCALIGAMTKGWTWSGTAGLVAGILAAIGGALHTFHAITLALGEYEGPPSGYEQLVHDHFWPLMLGYMLGPAIVICLVYEAWRRAASVESRSSSS